ncbi:TolC family protein [Prevotella sp. PINT]|jgi:Outer membrane protein|uniref:TolC family protein n=1 Tax=Palleniella intestinalis TaxID=2736291 RepID=UPI00155324D6|nr:TolC family protein [Palleniella intestinalis]NPD82615.1 TolC family protein [Palleniella intestinalis]
MKLKRVSVILVFAMASLASWGQAWDLRQCIDYAMEHNISLQKSRISVKEAQTDLLTAKAQMFPSLTFNTNQNVTNRPWSENAMNVVSDGTGNMMANSSQSATNYNGNYGLNASWLVWNGGQRKKNIEQAEIQIEQAELATASNANTIQEQIVQNYVQILYAKESVKVNESTLAVSKAQRDRAAEMVKVGHLSKTDLAQLEAQVANDEYNLVNARTQVARYKIALKQLLELTGDETFDIATIEVSDRKALSSLPAVEEVYSAALTTRPEIRSGQLSRDAAELDIALAKAGRMPNVSLNAGIGTSNYSGSDNSLTKQWKQNWNNTVGLSVSVPILSNRKNRSAVEKAKLQRQASDLDLQDLQKQLYNEIEGYWLDAVNARQQFRSACTNEESMQASFNLVSEQFNLGLKNLVELMDGKNNLQAARQSKLQSKYTFILNEQLLKFYAGESINL